MGWHQAASWDGRSFRFEGLAPGAYDLGVGSGISEESVVYVEGIHVTAGAQAHDVRLQPLDLRGRFWSFDVLAVDESNRPVPARLLAFYAGGDVAQLGSSGKRQILAREREVEAMVVQAKGYFSLLLKPFQGTRKVILKRGLPVVLVWPDQIKLPEHEGIRLHVHLEPEGQGDPGTVSAGAARFGRDNSPAAGFSKGGATRLELAVPAAGTYRVVVALRGERKGLLATEPLTLSAGGRLRVGSGGPAPEHHIQWRQEELARALGQLALAMTHGR